MIPRRPRFAARWVQALGVSLALCAPAAAQINAYTATQAGYGAPLTLPNLVTLGFDSGSPPVTAAGLTSSTSLDSGFLCTSGTFSYATAGAAETGFSGKYAKLTSGKCSSTGSTLTVNFSGGGTPYVSFLWNLAFSDGSEYLNVKYTISNGTTTSTVDIGNCPDTNSTGCVPHYAVNDGGWLFSLIGNILLGILDCGGPDTTGTVRLSYLPPTGYKVTKIEARAKRNAAGLLCLTTRDNAIKIDNLSYVDGTVNPHHLEITSTSATGPAGNPVTFTIKACANADCSQPYTTGVSGSLSVSGVGMTVVYPAGSTFAIPAGSSSTTLSATVQNAGTVTVALTSLSRTPSGSPPVYCGLGVAAASGNGCAFTATVPLHHLELTTASSSALTCAPITYTVKACANASCSSTYTSGVTGRLSVSGAGLTVNYPGGQDFTIPAGSASTTLSAHVTKVGTATASVGNVLPVATGTPAVYCGMGVPAVSGGSCNVSLADSRLLFSVGDHRAEAAQTMLVKAVQSSDDAKVCVPALAGLTRAVTFRCGYTNPASGSRAVRLDGTALNSVNSAGAACDGVGRSVTLSFNASGVATTTVQYADVGSVWLAASYAGTGSEAGLTMTGNASFTAIPAGWAITRVTSGPLRAGSPFEARVDAVNGVGAVTPNFGRESPAEGASLAFARRVPTGAGAKDGVFTGSVAGFGSNGGHASADTLSWTEVGRGDLVATLTSGSYRGTGLSVSGASCAVEGDACVLPAGAVATVHYGANGAFAVRTGQSGTVACTNAVFGDPAPGVAKTCSYTVTGGAAGALSGATGAFGPFIPHHFTVSVAQACSSVLNGTPVASTYSGQPFGVTITAFNAAGGVTQNHDGSSQTTPNQATAVTLSAATNALSGSFNGTEVIAASSFVAGVAEVSTPAFTFNSKLTAPTSVVVRATDASNVSSSGHAEGAVVLRSGRLKVSNVFGSEKTPLSLPVQAQYWSGRAWVLNAHDSCTTVPASAVALSGYRNHRGASTTAWTTAPQGGLTMSGGHGAISFSAPSPSATGSVDMALNLGTTTADQSCLAVHPATTGAARGWLRSQYGSSGACAAAVDRDPSARITFGVYVPESSRTIYARDVF